MYIYKVGFIREKRKAIVRKEQSPEIGSSGEG
jgi:hypothetical protein